MRLTGGAFETQRRHKTIFINNLAYIAHHKHAYILSTNREIERERREKGEKISQYKRMHQINMFFFCFFFKIPTTRGQKQDRLQTRKKKILHESKHLLNTYRTEKDRCKERETLDSYIQVTSKGVFFF